VFRSKIAKYDFLTSIAVSAYLHVLVCVWDSSLDILCIFCVIWADRIGNSVKFDPFGSSPETCMFSSHFSFEVIHHLRTKLETRDLITLVSAAQGPVNLWNKLCQLVTVTSLYVCRIDAVSDRSVLPGCGLRCRARVISSR